MKIRLKKILRQNGPFYLFGCLLISGMKLSFGSASPDNLKWMLTPTAWWVSILSKISFSYDPHMGYVSHAWHFVIAPSCSGVRFLIICTAMLLFSYLHRINTRRGKLIWMACGPVIAYAYTVFFNGLRIAASIHLPYRFAAAGLLDGRLTPKRLHTLTGVVLYFTALLLLALTAELIFGKTAAKRQAYRSGRPALLSAACRQTSVNVRSVHNIPLLSAFWYFLFVLALPLASRLLRHNWNGFGEYALLVFGGCLTILLMGKTALFLCRKLMRSMRKAPRASSADPPPPSPCRSPE